MLFFDRVEEKNVNGDLDVYAVNEQDNQMYLLRNIMISFNNLSQEGVKLTIKHDHHKYCYRSSFKSLSDAEQFANSILRQINEVENKKRLFQRA